MTIQTQRPLESDVALEGAATVALAAMRRQRSAVHALPSLASKELRVSLRGLVAWYERLCIDREYATPAPAEGIDALPRVTLDAEAPSYEAVTAWWAVRVAEEVVACRRLLGNENDVHGAEFEVALSQLEIAMYGWNDRLNDFTPETTSPVRVPIPPP
jgi:hypothetical protein